MIFFWKRSKLKIVREHTTQWRDEDIPRYPPFMKGLPCVPPEKLLESQAELIDRIANTAVVQPAQFERHYLSAIERFAQYAHLLPASQTHHHRGAGGLLRHSIEVGLWALQAADRVLLDTASTPFQRREMEPRWQLAVFLAGLCHDAGKPVTDITVTNKDRTSIWKPIKEDLYAWATKNSIKAYFLDWRDGRARQHTALSNLIADRIIGSETLEWIEEGGTELIVWLMESLTYNPGPTNLIYNLVIKADQTSVERDLKTMGAAMAGYEIGVPIERYLTDIMRRFVREGLWLVNEPGARLWNIGGNIFLVWPAAGEEIAKQVREDGIPGIPRTPDSILDMLVERQIAFIREGVAPDDRLWKIAPAILAEKIPDIRLTAIMLKDEVMVSSTPIPQVDGRIVNDERSEVIELQQPSSHHSDENAAMMNTSDAGICKFDHNQGSVVDAQNDSAQTCVSPVHGGPASGDEEQRRPDTAHPREKKPVRSMPSLSGAEGTKATITTTTKRTGVASIGVAMKFGEVTTARKQPMIVLDGAVGEAIKALAHDLKSGDKRWGIDVIIDSGKFVLLRWPGAFSGYGLTPKSILDELSSREWLWIDQMTPLKKVVEARFEDGTAKAIRLTPDISHALISEAGVDLNCSHIETDTQKPRLDVSKKTPDESGITELSSTSVDTLAPSGGQPAMISESACDGTIVDHGAVDSAKSDGLPSLDDVIGAIKDLQVSVQPDGYLIINRNDVIEACVKHGLWITHKSLRKLANKDPERLSVNGDVVRFRL